MAKIAQPVILTESYWKPIEQIINEIFMDLFFKPILEEKKGLQLSNSKDLIVDAIKSGKVYFEGQVLKGDFNRALTKELRKINGRYNGRSKAWSFDTIPAELQIAKAQAQAVATQTAQAIITKLDTTNVLKTVQASNIVEKYNKITGKMTKEFEKTLKDIAVMPKTTDTQRDIISKQWGENLELYITEFSEKQILELRENIRTKVLTGGRAASLEKVIQETYSTTKAKARFLARQETSLLMSKMREARYREAGSKGYIWSGAMDERERPDHKLLQGKFIDWTEPPIVDRKTGRKAHAGEDFGCRCTARPVFD